jgi:Uma2 family endonuclease
LVSGGGKIVGVKTLEREICMPATMRTASAVALRRPREKIKRQMRPTWEIAELLYPRQGEWTEEAFLDLPDDELRVELVDGWLEFLPMPTKSHELTGTYIYHLLFAFVTSHRLGEVYWSGRRVKLRQLNIRLPDITFVPFSKVDPDDEQYCLGADLVMEIVSGSSKYRVRDLKEKFADYAKAGIEEYWIIDPKLRQISVLNLKEGRYSVRREFKPGQKAASSVLKGFEVDVTQALSGFKFPR